MPVTFHLNSTNNKLTKISFFLAESVQKSSLPSHSSQNPNPNSAMDLASNFRTVHIRLNFFSGSSFRHRFHPIAKFHLSFSKKTSFNKIGSRNPRVSARVSVGNADVETKNDTNYEALFSENSVSESSKKQGKKRSNSGASSVSSGIRLENVAKSYKGATVLKDVSWEVKKGEKVGLVGVNGAGKTTQLRIIAGLEEPDTGNLVKAKENMKITFLSQEFEVCTSRTVKEEFLSAFREEMEVAERLEKVQKALEGSVEDLGLMGRLLDELDLLQRRARDVNLDIVDVKINKLMPELGFMPQDSDRLVASFSGGWQMRMSLGKILLQDPDLLLLDEPTNHLDLDTIEWLEVYLQKQDVPMVIISHDRAFLDQLCTKIVETDMGVSRTFAGNYSEYVLAKAASVEAQYAAWEKQQKEIEHTKELINRLGAGANSGRASSEEKKLEKLLKEEQIEKPFQRKQMKFRFPERGRSGRTVLMIKNLQFGYEGEMLFDKANLLVERGEKIAIIGPNGCGKSSLLKLIMGLEKPKGGEVSVGEHNVLPNYFEQNQAEALELEKTVLQTVEESAEDWRIDDIKGLLGRYNFKADMLDRKVSLLSGGEKARLAFCKFMVKPSTLLVLDEPTNHLDIPTKEMLEEAIAEYEGSVITVSHDRYFIKQIVNRVVEVEDGNLQDYAGDYNYYLEKNLKARERALEREAELEEKAPKVKAKSKMSKEEKEARKKQKMKAFQQANAKSKGLKNAKRWK
ncbi:ABC family 1 [Iris pallida]|uniref:ABC family 1 n=1 Tax=Iris pallida TaxID=29817 RepID=A0AAX6EEE1_IRIPA|nr:ABC family 1 [Iris pallida]